MTAIAIAVHGRYSQYGKPSTAVTLYPSVEDEEFVEDAVVAVRHSDNVIIRDKRKVLDNDKLNTLMGIAKNFDFSARPQGHWEAELNSLLKKVL